MLVQEEDRNETNKYDEAFRSLRSEIFKHNGEYLTCPNILFITPVTKKIRVRPSRFSEVNLWLFHEDKNPTLSDLKMCTRLLLFICETHSPMPGPLQSLSF